MAEILKIDIKDIDEFDLEAESTKDDKDFKILKESNMLRDNAIDSIIT